MGSPNKNSKTDSTNYTFKHLFYVTPYDVGFRMFASFMPPLTKKYQKVYVDFVGPMLAVILLSAFVNYGYLNKHETSNNAPTETVLGYCILMPALAHVMCKLSSSYITLYEITCLIGYSLYGHILTLFISYLCFEEESNFFFFISLIVFCGLSTMRLGLTVLGSIAVPAARLLVCSVICVIHILFLIFLHFAYMHPTITYEPSEDSVF